MPTTLRDIPRERGRIVGEYRLRHHNKSYSATIGGVKFVDGVSQKPVGGFVLQRLVAAAGRHFNIEPWADAPPPEEPSEGVPVRVLSDEALEAMSVEELRELAGELDVKADGRWGKARLIEAVVEVLTAPDGAGKATDGEEPDAGQTAEPVSEEGQVDDSESAETDPAPPEEPSEK